jgi:hypothetical protein
MSLNNLLASPGFSSWMEGEPLDIARMLRAPDGRPRLSIVSIAHLSDPERMFVVTLVLGQLIAWMRSQSGSQSLRAILYMDEVFGYFPPTANPPSKTPMLTLLKQARAYGVGVVLATQNPVDLDYKGLSNCGTWLLGRLQTERDKARVIDGLESADGGGALGLDRKKLEKTLSNLDSRVFLMNNVHEDEPVLLRSRWVLSYLAGPLSRNQIKQLAKAPKAAIGAVQAAARAVGEKLAAPSKAAVKAAATQQASARPVVPSEANERFIPVTGSLGSGDGLIYRPILLGEVSVHYSNKTAGVDEWSKKILWTPLDEDLDGVPWSNARLLASLPELEEGPDVEAAFDALPGEAERATSYTKWAKQLKTAVYRDHPLLLWKSKKPKLVSVLGEEEGAFRGRLSDLAREDRDLQLEKLRVKYAPKLARYQEKIDRANERVQREEQQYQDRKTQTAVSFGATVIGALFGRKLGSVGNVGRAASSIKGVSRAAKEKSDIDLAEARVEEYQQELRDLELEFEKALEEAHDEAADFANEIEIEELRVNARKGDLEVQRLCLVWVPSRVGAGGEVELIGTLES